MVVAMHVYSEVKENQMKCPIDSVDLQMAERQGVEIDYCPQCRGVWLDRGELDKIIERSESRETQGPAVPERAAVPQYGGHHGGGYGKHGRKSWLRDIFD